MSGFESNTEISTAPAPKKLSKREVIALLSAHESSGGWGLFNRKTTERLAGFGYFEKSMHSIYGMQWRITPSGRSALAAARGEA